MTDLEILFLFEKPLTGWEQKSLDTWISASPWKMKPGTWVTWALSYGPIQDNFLQAAALVTVGSKATRFVLEQEGLVTYTTGNNPRPKKLDPKLVNRVYRVTPISGFGSFRFLVVLKTEGQLRMAQKFAEQSGYPVRPVGTKRTIEVLWTLKFTMTAVPINPAK